MNKTKLWLILTAVGCLLVFSPGCDWTEAGSDPSSQVGERTPALHGLILGTSWYPEQWEESRWEQDLNLMQAAGVRMVRVAEYAWSRMEPSEGRFEFDWLERAIALAGKHEIFVLLGTPTGAPPAWLTQKYTDVLRVDEAGRRATHGGREHFSYSSENYRKLGRRIAEQMAKRFSHNPNVIGWQVDNEEGFSSISYDRDMLLRFQQWLKGRYRTLESLNRHWATNYWSQTYSDWGQIPFPLGYNANPSLKLEWFRFASQMLKDYLDNQIAAIRAYSDSRQFITHNFSAGDVFDYYVVAEELTFASVDDYVGSGHLDPVLNGLMLDLTRGFKRAANFWITETAPGSGCWRPINNALDRGEVRAMAWETVGHGAECVSYWQWRSAPAGREQYYGTLVGVDGRPMPIYSEVAQLGNEFAQLGEAFRGTAPVAQTALLQDYESDWAIQFQRHHQDFYTVRHFGSFYRPLRSLTHEIDVIHPSAPLAQYRLVVAPHLNVLPDPVALHLLDYVKGGGILVLGPRTGMKDSFNAFLPARQPGVVLSQPLGGAVLQFYALDKPVSVVLSIGEGKATVWAEMLEAAQETNVLLRYGKSNGWLDGKPTVISQRVGAGTIVYVGAWLDDELMNRLSAWMIEGAGVKPPFGRVPEGVEVCRRTGPDRELYILINHTTQSKTVSLPCPMRELLRNAALKNCAILAPREVAVLAPAE